jgi:hypothetical protein
MVHPINEMQAHDFSGLFMSLLFAVIVMHE